MTYYLIAGEASGDLHGAKLMHALREKDPDASFRFWGGDRMKEAGGDMVRDYRETAFMGFLEVLLNLRRILRYLKECKQDLSLHRPDALILIDYPGFNLRVAEFAHKEGIPVYYYISPQVWAWKKGRVKKIRKVVDRMFVILPFEKDFYKEYDYEVEFVGHPLIDAIEAEKERMPDREGFFRELGKEDRPYVALLPGSREQEVRRMLPVMCGAKDRFPDLDFLVLKSSSLPEELYREAFEKEGVDVVENRNYALLEYAEAALVTSGTATLEAGLIGTPLVVCYAGGALSFWIAKRLVDVPYISLVNLIMEKEVVKELIQKELTAERAASELERVLPGGPDHERVMEELSELHRKLGGRGASEYTAGRIVSLLQEKQKE